MNQMTDGEMPTDKPIPAVGSDGKFHVPSQFVEKLDSDPHHRFKANIVVRYFSSPAAENPVLSELKAEIDFTDFAISEDSPDELDPAELFQQIEHDGLLIALQVTNEGIQEGDWEQVIDISEDKESIRRQRILTAADIERAKQILAEERAIAMRNQYN